MKNRVGTCYTSCRIENPIDRKKSVAVPKILVDSDAMFTRVNGKTLKKIGLDQETNCTFINVSGRETTRTIGYAIIGVGDAETIDEVVFGEPGDLEILGARTLEGMNLRVDPRAKKLVAGGPILAAAQNVAKAVGK